MATQSKYVEMSSVDGIPVVKIVGETVLFELTTIEETGQALYAIAEKHSGETIILDLHHVEYAATAMLGKLLALNSRVRKRHCHLKLRGLGPNLVESLELLNILGLFEVCDDGAHALEAAPDSVGTTDTSPET